MYDKVNSYIVIGLVEKRILIKDILVVLEDSYYSNLDINVKNEVIRRKIIILI